MKKVDRWSLSIAVGLESECHLFLHLCFLRIYCDKRRAKFLGRLEVAGRFENERKEKGSWESDWGIWLWKFEILLSFIVSEVSAKHLSKRIWGQWTKILSGCPICWQEIMALMMLELWLRACSSSIPVLRNTLSHGRCAALSCALQQLTWSTWASWHVLRWASFYSYPRASLI